MNSDSEKLTKELKKRGIPSLVMEVILTPQQEEWQEEIEREVWECLMETEDAHEIAIDSTLIFGESGAPDYFRRPISLSSTFLRLDFFIKKGDNYLWDKNNKFLTT